MIFSIFLESWDVARPKPRSDGPRNGEEVVNSHKAHFVNAGVCNPQATSEGGRCKSDCIWFDVF